MNNDTVYFQFIDGKLNCRLYEVNTGRTYSAVNNELKILEEVAREKLYRPEIKGKDLIIYGEEINVVLKDFRNFRSFKHLDNTPRILRMLNSALDRPLDTPADPKLRAIYYEERRNNPPQQSSSNQPSPKRKKKKKLAKPIQKVLASAAVAAVLISGIAVTHNLAENQYSDVTDIDNIRIEQQVDLNQYNGGATEDEVLIVENDTQATTGFEDEGIVINNLRDETNTTTAINARKWEDSVTKYANKWGISPNVIMGMLTQESGGYVEDNLMQIQFWSWEDQVITVYNFEDDRYENIVLTSTPEKYRNYQNIQCINEKDLKNPNTNISVGTILLRKSISYMDGNLLLGIQCYNFGPGNMKTVLNVVQNKTGYSMDQLLEDVNLINEIMEQTGVIKEGDREYLNHVMRYVEGNTIFLRVKNSDGSVKSVEIVFQRDNALNH